MGVMDQIMEKARHESNYGQLLAAEIMKTSLAGEISPDSIPGFINNLVEEERTANTQNPTLAAVYQTVLANVMKIGDYDTDEAEKYRKKAWTVKSSTTTCSLSSASKPTIIKFCTTIMPKQETVRRKCMLHTAWRCMTAATAKAR